MSSEYPEFLTQKLQVSSNIKEKVPTKIRNLEIITCQSRTLADALQVLLRNLSTFWLLQLHSQIS